MTADVALLRAQIESVDERLIGLIAERLTLARAVGRAKCAAGRPVTDPAREAAVVARASSLARESGVPEDEIRALYWRLLAMSRRAQLAYAGGRITADEGWGEKAGADIGDEQQGRKSRGQSP